MFSVIPTTLQYVARELLAPQRAAARVTPPSLKRRDVYTARSRSLPAGEAGSLPTRPTLPVDRWTESGLSTTPVMDTVACTWRSLGAKETENAFVQWLPPLLLRLHVVVDRRGPAGRLS